MKKHRNRPNNYLVELWLYLFTRSKYENNYLRWNIVSKYAFCHIHVIKSVRKGNINGHKKYLSTRSRNEGNRTAITTATDEILQINLL